MQVTLPEHINGLFDELVFFGSLKIKIDNDAKAYVEFLSNYSDHINKLADKFFTALIEEYQTINSPNAKEDCQKVFNSAIKSEPVVFNKLCDEAKIVFMMRLLFGIYRLPIHNCKAITTMNSLYKNLLLQS